MWRQNIVGCWLGKSFDNRWVRLKAEARHSFEKTPRQRPVVSSSCSSWFIYPIAIAQKVLRWMNSEVQMFLSLAADENIKPELDGMLRNVHIFANRIWMNKIVKQNLLKCNDSLIDWVCHCSKASDGQLCSLIVIPKDSCNPHWSTHLHLSRSLHLCFGICIDWSSSFLLWRTQVTPGNSTPALLRWLRPRGRGNQCPWKRTRTEPYRPDLSRNEPMEKCPLCLMHAFRYLSDLFQVFNPARSRSACFPFDRVTCLLLAWFLSATGLFLCSVDLLLLRICFLHILEHKCGSIKFSVDFSPLFVCAYTYTNTQILRQMQSETFSPKGPESYYEGGSQEWLRDFHKNNSTSQCCVKDSQGLFIYRQYLDRLVT